MAEEMIPREETEKKPRSFWQNALRTVKGDNTTELVEQFTSEMTLVAEGLCDDQGRLRKELEDIRREHDRSRQQLQSGLDVQETQLEENRRDTDARLDELERRVEALEKNEKQHQKEKSAEKEQKGGKMRQLIILASILSGTAVILSVLSLVRSLL